MLEIENIYFWLYVNGSHWSQIIFIYCNKRNQRKLLFDFIKIISIFGYSGLEYLDRENYSTDFDKNVRGYSWRYWTILEG